MIGKWILIFGIVLIVVGAAIWLIETLGLPLVGSYHTELGPYALHLTRDLLVAEAFDRYVEWFYRQCALVLGPIEVKAQDLESVAPAQEWQLGRRESALSAIDQGRGSFWPVRADPGL